MRVSFLLVCLLVVSLAAALQGRRRSGPKVNLCPFFRLSATAGFDVIKADKAIFNEMQGLTVSVGSETIPQFKHPQVAIQMEYGYKKGGISMVYETLKAPGTTAKAVFDKIIESRIFRDHQYKSTWSIVPVEDKKLFIMVSGTTPEVRDAMVKALKH